MRYEELCNPQAESGVISTLIHNPQFIFHSEELEPRDFLDKTNQILYWAIREIVLGGNTVIDDFSITTKLSSNKAVEAKMEKLNINSIKDILELSKYATQNSVEAYKDLVKDVREYALRRNLFVNAKNLSVACTSEKNTSEDLHKMLNQTVDLYDMSMLHGREIKTFSKKIAELWNKLKARHSGEIVTRPFHIKELNEYTQMEDGEMVLIGGYAKSGKSAALLSIFVDLLRKNETPLIIDSELSDDLFFMRLLAHIAHVRFKKVKDGTYDKEEETRVNEAKEWLETKTFYHEYLPVCDKNEIASIFRRVNNEQKISILIIDYFKADYETGDAYVTATSLTALVNYCKNEIAGVYKIPVLGAVQTSEAGKVSFSSSVVTVLSTLCWLSLKTQDEINADGSDCGNAKMSILYNRNGTQMLKGEYLDLQFDGDFISYTSAKKQHTVIEPY